MSNLLIKDFIKEVGENNIAHGFRNADVGLRENGKEVSYN